MQKLQMQTLTWGTVYKKYKGFLESVSYNEPPTLEFEDEPDL